MGLWECGQSRPRARNPKTARMRIVHISTAQPLKESFIKSPAGLLRHEERRTGTSRRQRRVWEAWSIQAPNPKPENSANEDCPPLSMLSAPRRTQSASSQKQRRQAEGWEEWGQSMPKARNPKTAQQRIVHRLSTLSAPPRTKNSRTTRKDKNPERRPSPSSEADESEPAQPRRGKTRTNPQRPAPAAIPPESRRPRDTMDGESYFGIDTRPNECANHAALRKNEGATRRRPEPTTEPARRQNTENWGILLRH